MSLGINTSTSEGLVLAADSRQSYRNRKGVSRIGSDSASKIFKLGKRCGLIVTGLAFFQDSLNGNVLRSIGQFVEDFCRHTQVETLFIKDIGDALHKFFEERYRYQDQLEGLPEKVKFDLEVRGCKMLDIEKKKDHVRFRFNDADNIETEGVVSVEQLQFIVAGYNSDNSHQVCLVNVPGDVMISNDSKQQNKEYGANWIGQIDVIARTILGYDGRIAKLPFVQKAQQDFSEDQIREQLRSLEYAIRWGTMTLQDGVDFSKLALETTMAIQRFSDGIQADPGDVPGVGGSIDVVVITKDKGFVWVSKKNLQLGDKEIDLEKL